MTAPSRLLVAVDVRTSDVAGAEHVVHLLDDVLPVDAVTYVASTHVVADASGPHTAVAASWDGDGRDSVEAWCDGVAGLLPGAGVVVESGDRVAVAGPQDRWDGARSAAAEHRSRRAGRVARFAGLPALEREVTVDEVLATGGVDEVVALGSPELAADAVLDLSEWARPTWRDGRSVLVVQPARSGLVPFESRHQIACCADH